MSVLGFGSCRWAAMALVGWLVISTFGGHAPGAPLIRTTTNDGVPLDESILIQLPSVLLRVPAGYLVPWPTQTTRGQVNKRDGLNINFWMPDLRYPEVNPISLDTLHPVEPGRGNPNPNTHIASAHQLRQIDLRDSGYISPETRFRNFTSLAGIASYSFEHEDFSLARFWRHDWPHPRPEPFIYYRHLEGANPQALLQCNPPHRPLPSPSCSGYIFFAGDDLAFFYRFPRNELPRWREIALAVRQLFQSGKATSQLRASNHGVPRATMVLA